MLTKQIAFVCCVLPIMLTASGCSTSGHQVSSDGSRPNDMLLAAASPFEDLTEFAQAKDQAGIDRSFADAREQSSRIKPMMSEQGRRDLDAVLERIEQRRSSGDMKQLALASIEGYRVLILALDDSALSVPKEVSLLDYCGFKLQVMAGSPPLDWAVIGQDVALAEQYWSHLRPRITDTGLLDSMDTVVSGLRRATDLRHPDMLSFAAQVDLDLVDLLEHYFEASHATKARGAR